VELRSRDMHHLLSMQRNHHQPGATTMKHQTQTATRPALHLPRFRVVTADEVLNYYHSRTDAIRYAADVHAYNPFISLFIEEYDEESGDYR